MIRTEGNVEIDSYGIATCKDNCSIYYQPEKGKLLNSAFSFLIYQLSPDANIKFGISDNSISFDYFSFLSDIRNEKITPQIQIDGIGILINIYVNTQGSILIYVNDELFLDRPTIRNLESYFYLNITDSTMSPTIIATPINLTNIEAENNRSIDEKKKYLYSRLPIDAFSRFFPSYDPDFWNYNQKTACISDFSIGSSSSFSQYNIIISQKPLLPLPCSGIKYYFEIIVKNFYKSNDSKDFSFGLTRHILLDSPNQQSSRSLPLHSFVFYNYRNDLLKHGTNRNNLNIRTKFDEYPLSLGFGLDNEYIYFTVNGDIACTIPLNNKMNDDELNDLKIYPFIMLPTRGIEIEFNFGQLPFKFSDSSIKLADGWSIYYPFHENIFKIGMSPHRHILNCFLSFGLQMETPSQLQLKNELVGEDVKYEVHMLHLENPELIGVGFSNKDFTPCQMVGWEKECVGLHSDDGKLFFQTGGGTMRVVEPNAIRTGTTETVELKGKNLTFYIDRVKKENVCVFPFEKYPAVTAKGGVEFILNFGESPFYAYEDDFEGDEVNESVTLFNKLKVKMSNILLPIFGLKVGDVIEARDRSFRGTIAGSSDDRLYVYTVTFPGAFPLVEANFLDFHLNYRIVYRSDSPLFQRIISTKRDKVVVDISQGLFDKIFPTQIGLSFFLGTSKINGRNFYVFRPVEDLINNDPVLVLSDMPRDIMSSTSAQIFPLFQRYDDQNDQTFSFQLFDVIQYTKKDKKKVFLVVGFDGKNDANSILCFDGSQFLRLESNAQNLNKKTLKFILNPFGFRRERFKYNYSYEPVPSYIGMTNGGRYFPFNFRGIYGSELEVENGTVDLFPTGERGCHLQPLLEFFLRKLNSCFSFLIIKENSNTANNNNQLENKPDENNWLYSTDEKKFDLNSKLVTNQEFCGKLIINNDQK